MATVLTGEYTWSCRRDEEGHRTYSLTHRVRSTTGLDGPAEVLRTPGLPQVGSVWFFFADLDVYAWCRATADVQPEVKGERCLYWRVTQEFSTKPVPADKQRCQDFPVEDPLLEPQKVSGSFVKYTVEGQYDRFGFPIRTSAWELIKGPQNEWDRGRPQVVVEQNVAALDLALVTSMYETVNSVPMWGLLPRCLKLSEFTWERRFQGVCSVYYVRRFTFDVDFNTFDRDLADAGTMVIRGHWDTDRNSPTSGQYIVDSGMSEDNPAHFQRYQDPKGNPGQVILDGHGRPFDEDQVTTGTGDDQAGVRHVEYYPESNFLLLGVPLFF